MATLVDFSGGVETQSHLDGSWEPAVEGAKLGKQSAVRTSAKSTARLRFTDGSTLSIDERSLMRFSSSRHEKAAYKLRMEIGTARFRTGDSEHILDVDDVVTKVGASSEFSIAKDRDSGTRLSLLVGEATVLSRSGHMRLEVGTIVELPESPEGSPSIVPVAVAADAGPPPEIVDAAVPTPTAADAGSRSTAQTATFTATLKRGRAHYLGQQNTWKPLPRGKSAVPADAEVKVAKKSTLHLQRGDKRVAVHGPAAFTVGGASESDDLIDLSRGKAIVTTKNSDIRIAVPGGAFSIKASPGQGSRAIVTAGPNSSSLRSRAGLSLAFGSVGPPTRINIGEVAILGTTGDLLVENRAPEQHDVTLRLGESPVIHDPAPPTAVQFDTSEACQGDAIVQVSTRQKASPNDRLAMGASGAALRLPAGTYWYRARCLDNGVASPFVGKARRLHIVKDSANRVLPSRVPQNTIEADGRSYDLRYEGTLPTLTFRWPKAPKGAATLHLSKPGGQPRSIKTTNASVTLKSGDVGEGSYEFFFRGASKQSRKTRLSIAFDPSAPSIELQSPPPSGNWGQTVDIRGIAAERWKVALRNRGTTTPVRRDAHGRFAIRRDSNTLGRAFSVQLSNPQSRPQLYLRRRR